MSWKESFNKGNEIILSTCSKKAEPNSNVVISLGFVENKLIVANCQMKTTIKNLEENNKIIVISANNGYYRLKGTVEIFKEGKYFDFCKNNEDDYKVNSAIVVSIEGVFDLDKGEKLI